MGVDIRISYLSRFSTFSLNFSTRCFVNRQILKLRPLHSFFISLSIYILALSSLEGILAVRVLELVQL